MATEHQLQYPLVNLITHPECGQEVVEHADVVRSANGMVEYASGVDRLIVRTEVVYFSS